MTQRDQQGIENNSQWSNQRQFSIRWNHCLPVIMNVGDQNDDARSIVNEKTVFFFGGGGLYAAAWILLHSPRLWLSQSSLSFAEVQIARDRSSQPMWSLSYSAYSRCAYFLENIAIIRSWRPLFRIPCQSHIASFLVQICVAVYMSYFVVPISEPYNKTCRFPLHLKTWNVLNWHWHYDAQVEQTSQGDNGDGRRTYYDICRRL